MIHDDLFAGFDPAMVAAASRQHQADKAETRRATAQKSANPLWSFIMYLASK